MANVQKASEGDVDNMPLIEEILALRAARPARTEVCSCIHLKCLRILYWVLG